MAADGIEFKSTPALPPGEAKLAKRRPLSSTRVEETPIPRRLAPLKPRWPAMSLKLAPSVSAAALADTFANSSAAVVTPERSISSRLMICTGSAVSASTRLMEEPVISTRSSLLGSVCASADCAASMDTASAAACAQGRSAKVARACRGEVLRVIKVSGWWR